MGLMQVLVTGHDGYIGRTLVPRLTAAGHEVRGMDITVVMTAKNDEEGRALLRLLGFPIKEA